MSYEQLGDLYGNQRLGAFDGPLGDVASAQRDFNNAQAEFNSAKESLNRITGEVHRPVGCSAIPGTPQMPKIACPSTAGPAQTKLAAAAKRLENANKTMQTTQASLESEKSAVAAGEVMKGVGAILNPLAQAGAGIFQAQQQAQLEKARLKAQGGGFAPMPMMMPAAKKSSLPLIIGGLAVVGVIVAVVVVAGGDDDKATKTR